MYIPDSTLSSPQTTVTLPNSEGRDKGDLYFKQIKKNRK